MLSSSGSAKVKIFYVARLLSPERGHGPNIASLRRVAIDPPAYQGPETGVADVRPRERRDRGMIRNRSPR